MVVRYSLTTILDTPEQTHPCPRVEKHQMRILDNVINFKEHSFTLIFTWKRLMNSRNFCLSHLKRKESIKKRNLKLL